MAPPLLTLKDVSLTFGDQPLLDQVELIVSAGDRICLVGRNGSGKSTLLSGLKKLAAVTVISCDDFYLPKDQCPRFSVAALPWPSGAVPAAFAERGDADMNVPGSVNWSGVLDAVSSAQSSEASNIVLDGLLLFGDHPGASDHRFAISMQDWFDTCHRGRHESGPHIRGEADHR